MTKPAADMETLQAHLESRRARMLESVDREVAPVASTADPLSRDQIDHLVREAEELYWNELAWEELTDEEAVGGGHLTELVFPGFLAFIDGLLLDSGTNEKFGVARPHPGVVGDILLFLAERHAEATTQLESGADSENLVWARAMTGQLIDLVLYRLYGLTDAERESIESRV